jgi:hypothetical protein
MSDECKLRLRRVSLMFFLCLFSIVVMVALSACGGKAGGEGMYTDSAGTRHYSYSGSLPPTLLINDKIGNITIHVGRTGDIAVHQNVVSGDSFGIESGTTQDSSGNTEIHISVINGAPDINFDIAVPVNTTLKMHTDQGNISVGTVSRQMTLSTNKGSITFNGSLSPGGVYRFEAIEGSVNIIAAKSSAFHLDATVMTGQFVAPDFPMMFIQHTNAGAEVHTDVGMANHPGAMVSVGVTTGSISLHKTA